MARDIDEVRFPNIEILKFSIAFRQAFFLAQNKIQCLVVIFQDRLNQYIFGGIDFGEFSLLNLSERFTQFFERSDKFCYGIEDTENHYGNSHEQHYKESMQWILEKRFYIIDIEHYKCNLQRQNYKQNPGNIFYSQ